MLVLLPPSETKAPGGRGRPLRLDRLSFPELTPVRGVLAEALTTLSGRVALARKTLKLSAGQDAELARNRDLWRSPTRPALERYAGVLYEALDYPGLPAAARRRADRRLVVVSALFGALRARDAIPAYRLSAGTVLPDIGGLRGLWRAPLTAALSAAGTGPGTALDLRSTAYQVLAPIPGAIGVRVVARGADGGPVSVSHHSKAYKGRLARAVCLAPGRPAGLDWVLAAAEQAGLRARRAGPTALELLV